MSASRLSTSMMRMGMLARATPASIAARQALPCTCQAVPRRLQSSTSSSETTAVGEASKASTSSSVLRQASMSSFGLSSSGTSNSAKIAQDSFKRQNRARTTLPVIKVRLPSQLCGLSMKESMATVKKLMLYSCG